MGYGDSGAPVLEPAKSEDESAERKAAALLLEQQKIVPPPPELQKMRSFVAAAEYANATVLVEPGKTIPMPPGFAAGASVQPLQRRDGDVWAKFTGGIIVTDDPQVINWCLEHPKVCRPAEDPMTKGWATIKDIQTPRANREAGLDASQLNADETFPRVWTEERLAAQAGAAKAGSAGAESVEAAESSLDATAKREAERAADIERLPA